jgi:hypothetical protein
MSTIVSDVQALNLIGDPLLYRIRLTGLIALYGHDLLQQMLVREAAQAGDNVVSIATASRWQRSITPSRDFRSVI